MMKALPTIRNRPIPEASLRRLPMYHQLLQKMLANGAHFVSCTTIAKSLNLDNTQVRKDIEATGIVGRPRTGYSLPSLVLWIEHFLGWDNAKDALLLGAGNLGSALLGYDKFRKHGLYFVAVLDTDPNKIGQRIHGKEILPLEKLPEVTQQKHVHLGVITTPAEAAQSVADLLVENGIRAIWNFAPVSLRVPDFVILQNEDLYRSLASLSFKCKRQMMAEQLPETGTWEQSPVAPAMRT